MRHTSLVPHRGQGIFPDSHPWPRGHPPRSLLLCLESGKTDFVLVVRFRVERQSAVHQPVLHDPDGCFCDRFYGAELIL
jgi:hypothetical protein